MIAAVAYWVLAAAGVGALSCALGRLDGAHMERRRHLHPLRAVEGETGMSIQDELRAPSAWWPEVENADGRWVDDEDDAPFRAADDLDRPEAETLRLSGRMCVVCGRIFPASQDRTVPGEGCPTPDACTLDMTTEEAFEHWRDIAHEQRIEIARMREALEAISSSKFCSYEETSQDSYGTGVTDGHRYCALVARRGLGEVE